MHFLRSDYSLQFTVSGTQPFCRDLPASTHLLTRSKFDVNKGDCPEKRRFEIFFFFSHSFGRNPRISRNSSRVQSKISIHFIRSHDSQLPPVIHSVIINSECIIMLFLKSTLYTIYQQQGYTTTQQQLYLPADSTCRERNRHIRIIIATRSKQRTAHTAHNHRDTSTRHTTVIIPADSQLIIVKVIFSCKFNRMIPGKYSKSFVAFYDEPEQIFRPCFIFTLKCRLKL